LLLNGRRGDELAELSELRAYPGEGWADIGIGYERRNKGCEDYEKAGSGLCVLAVLKEIIVCALCNCIILISTRGYWKLIERH
jgi:hypothetical protein